MVGHGHTHQQQLGIDVGQHLVVSIFNCTDSSDQFKKPGSV
jgi:hypothetical protein